MSELASAGAIIWIQGAWLHSPLPELGNYADHLSADIFF